MASSARRIVVEFLGDDKSLSRTASSVDSHTSKLGATFSKVGKAAALGLGAGLVAAGAAAVDFIKAASEDQAAAAKLATALKNTTGATDDQVASVEDWISKTSLAVGVADDDLRPALQRLVEATGSVSKGQKLMSLALDVSAGTGKDLGAVTLALAKAQTGSLGGLSRYGIATKDAAGNTLSLQQVTAKMADTFGGQAAVKADTFSGKMSRLNVMFNEAKESIGYKLIPIVTDLADVFINDVVPAVQKAGDWFQTNLQPKIEEFARIAQAKIGEFAQYIRDHMDEIKATISDVLDVITTIWSKWGDDVFRVVGIYMKLIFTQIRGAFTIIKGIFEVFSGLLHGDWSKVWQGLKDIVKGVWILIQGVVKAGWGLLREAFRLGGEALKGIMGGIWGGVKDIAGNLVDDVVSAVRDLPSRLRGLGSLMLGAGKSIIGKFVDGLKDIGAIGGLAEDVFSAITGALKDVVNFIIDQLNTAIPNTLEISHAPDINLPDNPIPHLARGTASFAGGIALVGEQGPELVSLPGGSAVYSNARSRQMLAGDFTATAPLNIVIEGRAVVQAILTFKRRNGLAELGIA